MVICLERGADLHTAQMMPLPFTVSCFSKIQTGVTFMVPSHPGSPGQRTVKWVCVCVVLLSKETLRINAFPVISKELTKLGRKFLYQICHILSDSDYDYLLPL